MLSYAIKRSAKLMLWFRERCVFLLQQFLQRDIIQCVLSLHKRVVVSMSLE